MWFNTALQRPEKLPMADLCPTPMDPETPLARAIWSLGAGLGGAGVFFLIEPGLIGALTLVLGLLGLSMAHVQLVELAASRQADRLSAQVRRLHGTLTRLGIEAEADVDGFSMILPGTSGATGIVIAPWGTWGQWLGLPGRRERELLGALRRRIAVGPVVDVLVWLPLATAHPMQRFLPSRFGEVHVVVGHEQRVLEALGVAG